MSLMKRSRPNVGQERRLSCLGVLCFHNNVMSKGGLAGRTLPSMHRRPFFFFNLRFSATCTCRYFGIVYVLISKLKMASVESVESP